MDFGGFLLFNALCDAVNDIGKSLKAHDYALIGVLCVAVLIITAFIMVLFLLFD